MSITRAHKTVFLAISGTLAALYIAKVSSVITPVARLNCDQIDAQALPDVVMYGTSWCSFCKKSRWFLEDRDITYCEYDIESSTIGAQQYRELNGRAIPLIIIGSEKINGFNEKALDAALQREGLVKKS